MAVPIVKMTINASGAAAAGAGGDLVVIVDVIDMSTTLEAALDEGALAVFGAAPDRAAPPVAVNPTGVAAAAGKLAVANRAGVVLVGEPRVGDDQERLANMSKILAGLKQTGATVEAILPNLGAETVKLHQLRDKVLIAATGAGGVAFDAAMTAGAPAVITGTVARTAHKKGEVPARDAARRAVALARETGAGITVVAASGNSLEDILAAEFITRLILVKLN